MIVKINVEGEEYPTIPRPDVSAREGIDALCVETDPWANCAADELAACLEASGFLALHRAVLRLSRA